MSVGEKQSKLDNAGLEQLFGSMTRVKLLKLFLNNPDKFYFVREIARLLKSQINSVRRELINLKNLGIVKEIKQLKEVDPSARKKGKKEIREGFGSVGGRDVLKKFFQANEESIFFSELKTMLLKADFLLEKKFIGAIRRAGSVDYLVLTGNFVGLPGIPVDLLMVGRFNRRKISRLIRDFEKDFGRAINYAIMSRQEFKYRKDITDRFLYSILENKKIFMVHNIE